MHEKPSIYDYTIRTNQIIRFTTLQIKEIQKYNTALKYNV